MQRHRRRPSTSDVNGVRTCLPPHYGGCRATPVTLKSSPSCEDPVLAEEHMCAWAAVTCWSDRTVDVSCARQRGVCEEQDTWMCRSVRCARRPERWRPRRQRRTTLGTPAASVMSCTPAALKPLRRKTSSACSISHSFTLTRGMSASLDWTRAARVTCLPGEGEHGGRGDGRHDGAVDDHSGGQGDEVGRDAGEQDRRPGPTSLAGRGRSRVRHASTGVVSTARAVSSPGGQETVPQSLPRAATKAGLCPQGRSASGALCPSCSHL